MKSLTFLFLSSLFPLHFSAGAEQAAAEPRTTEGSAIAPAQGKLSKKPNIVILFADDLGITDLGCYGKEHGNTYHETPHIDQLAQQGMLFTDAYAASPVCSPTRASILTGKYPARLRLTDFLPGQIQPQFKRVKTAQPEQQFLPPKEVTFAQALKEGGYSTWFFGKWHLGKGQPTDFGFEQEFGAQQSEANRFYPFKKKQKNIGGAGGDTITDVFTDKAAELIGKRREQWDNGDKKPFLIYMSYYLVHMPIKAREEGIAHFEAKKKTKKWKRADYAAMLKILDDNVGRLMQALKDNGFADDTVVLFYSDNGGHTCTSNYPYRGYKGSIYEGGIKEPLIVKWPDKITPGSRCSELINTPDIYPTLLDLAQLPQKPAQHPDGQSFYHALTGKEIDKEKAIFWHHPHYRDNAPSVPASVIRKGNYKLIRHYESGTTQLYDLEDDPSEKQNLNNRHPKKVKQLDTRLDRWLKDVNAVVPQKNPRHDPQKAKNEIWGGPGDVARRKAKLEQQQNKEKTKP
jgi:arylsulfatase A